MIVKGLTRENREKAPLSSSFRVATEVLWLPYSNPREAVRSDQ